MISCAVIHESDEHTNESDVHATGGEGTTFCRPPQAVLKDPCVEVVLSLLGETQVGVSNTLQDIVVVLGGTEH